jgi:hypothetical protein
LGTPPPPPRGVGGSGFHQYQCTPPPTPAKSWSPGIKHMSCVSMSSNRTLKLETTYRIVLELDYCARPSSSCASTSTPACSQPSSPYRNVGLCVTQIKFMRLFLMYCSTVKCTSSSSVAPLSSSTHSSCICVCTVYVCVCVFVFVCACVCVHVYLVVILCLHGAHPVHHRHLPPLRRGTRASSYKDVRCCTAVWGLCGIVPPLPGVLCAAQCGCLVLLCCFGAL